MTYIKKPTILGVRKNEKHCITNQVIRKTEKTHQRYNNGQYTHNRILKTHFIASYSLPGHLKA